MEYINYFSTDRTVHVLLEGGIAMEEKKKMYVDVAEVCRDWGCSRSMGYKIIKQLSEQMLKENPKLLVMSGKINRVYYEEVCLQRH